MRTRRVPPTSRHCATMASWGTARPRRALYNLAFVPVMRGEVDVTRERFLNSLAIARDIGRDDLGQSQLPLGISLARGRGEAGGAGAIAGGCDFLRRNERSLPACVRPRRMAVTTHRALGRDCQPGRATWRHLASSPTPGLCPESVQPWTWGGYLASWEGRHTAAVRLTAAAAALRETTSSIPADVHAAAGCGRCRP